MSPVLYILIEYVFWWAAAIPLAFGVFLWFRNESKAPMVIGGSILGLTWAAYIAYAIARHISINVWWYGALLHGVHSLYD